MGDRDWLVKTTRVNLRLHCKFICLRLSSKILQFTSEFISPIVFSTKVTNTDQSLLSFLKIGKLQIEHDIK